MSDSEDLDLDVASVEAWEQFRYRLSNELLLLDDGGHLLLDTEECEEDGEVRPYVQFAFDEGVLHLEVSSNTYLTGIHRLTLEQELELAGLGLVQGAADLEHDDGEAFVVRNWSIDDAPEDDGHLRLAEIAVAALRDVFGVIHPAFVHSDQLHNGSGGSDGDDELEYVITPFPSSRAHLVQLVDEALEPVFGQPPIHDDDEDIPVIGDEVVAYVRVHHHAPIVEIFGAMATNVTAMEAATFEVAVLNRDSAFVRYVLEPNQTVMARLSLPARPFVADHLRDMLELFTTVVQSQARDLVHRVQGTLPTDPDDIEPF